MLPEDRLDALLSLHAENSPGQPSANGYAEFADLQPLLDASARLEGLRNAEPTPEFAGHLETLFLATAASLREQSEGGESAVSFSGDIASRYADGAPPRLGNDFPTLPGVRWDALDSMDNQTTEANGSRQPTVLRPRTPWRHLLWSALAAALLVAIGATTLTVAAGSGPGTPLYGLHRWEQDVRVGMAGSAADRASLHLAYARDALSALNNTVAQRQTGSAYDDALATFSEEMRATSASLAEVPAGGEQNALAAQFGQLRTQGRSDLHAALAVLPWAKRITTTSALAALGDNVLSVARADMVYSGHGQHLWRITITGSGFQPGATLLVNGQPAGTVNAVNPTTLVAQLSGDDSAPLPATIGVANPDNTAAATTSVRSNERDDATPGAQQTPGAQPSPTADDHGGDRHGGNSGPGGGH
jgi:hypothetical protein